jgi:HAD superfamily hydrolase (TIGR01459 family)
VLLLTNAPRPATAVEAQLARLGLVREAYDAVITSGDTGLAALRASGRDHTGFIGTAEDRRILGQTGIKLLDGAEGDIVVCTGLRDGSADPADHDADLKAMCGRDATLYCFNPDRVVMRGELLEPCAGAIADRYEAIGGRVEWFGKPFPVVYERCLKVGGELVGRPVERSEVIAVGDSLKTDFVGAAHAGFDFVFITHGIEAERIQAEGLERVVADFAAGHGIALPTPVASAPRLS